MLHLRRVELSGLFALLVIVVEALSSVAAVASAEKVTTRVNGEDAEVGTPPDAKRALHDDHGIHAHGAGDVGSDGSLQPYEDMKHYSNGLTPQLMRLLDDPADTEDVELTFPFVKWEFPNVKHLSGTADNEISADTGAKDDIASVLQSIVNAPPKKPPQSASRLLTLAENDHSASYGSNVNVQHSPPREQSIGLDMEELDAPLKAYADAHTRKQNSDFKSPIGDCDPCLQSILPEPQRVLRGDDPAEKPSSQTEKGREIELPGGLGTITEGEVDEFVDSLLMKAKLNKQQREQRTSRALTRDDDVVCTPCNEASSDSAPLPGATKYFEVDGDKGRQRLGESREPVQTSKVAPRQASMQATGLSPRSSFFYQLPNAAENAEQGAGESKASTASLLYHVNELKSGKPTVISLDPSTAENFLHAINTRGPALQVVEIPFEEVEEEEGEETNDDKDSREQKPKAH